jgi:KUP system potassium uptake protein
MRPNEVETPSLPPNVPVRSTAGNPEPTTQADPAAAPPGDAAPPDASGRHHAIANPVGKRLAVLTLTALGVVYGDLGTSPLYTMRETFSAKHGMTPDAATVYGVLCLVFWSLILVVVVKYLVFILRADNRGEGGVLAMLALILQKQQAPADRRRRAILIILGVFGTALLFGDGVITPAISVLGAVEGLEIATPQLEPFVVGIAVVILFVLFVQQKRGTGGVGKAFGPLTLIWFITIGALGFREIIHEPRILAAVNPLYGARFFGDHGFAGFIVLGAVFLAVTGAEALYADIGHFGKKPIRLAFFALVLPALLLNYFGQGALLLRMPSAVTNPFYLLAPRWFLYPLLVIATLAAIVASQALISGAFSLAQQSVQLGYSPRLTIVHTSSREHGQIYVPEVNKALMVGTLLIVLGFRSSDALGAAYGIAVTGTMAITTMLFAVVARTQWRWPLWQVVTLATFFFAFDFAFLGANALKIADGGWVPLAIALSILTLMTTWKRGRQILADIMHRSSMPLDLLLGDLSRKHVHRVPGTAVFLTSDPEGAPVVLLHHLKHNKVLHQQVVLLSVVSADVPDVDDHERVIVTPLEHGFFRVTALYGFMEAPNVPRILAMSERFGLRARPNDTSYFLGRERLIPTGRSRMARWRKKLFSILSRNALSATEFFGIPPNRVVELGAQIEF